MKFFNVHINKTFTGKSTDYVTKEAVERANARLMGQGGVAVVAGEDVYARHQLQRPSREDIAKAAAKAMQQVVIQN